MSVVGKTLTQFIVEQSSLGTYYAFTAKPVKHFAIFYIFPLALLKRKTQANTSVMTDVT